MRHLAIAAACLALTASAGHASPAYNGNSQAGWYLRSHGVFRTPKKAKRHRARHTRKKREHEVQSESVAFAAQEPKAEATDEGSAVRDDENPIDTRDEDDSADVVDVAPKPRTHRAHEWNVAIGPYLWATAVDANVSLGQASVDAGSDFSEVASQDGYGAMAIAEVRYRRFSIVGDLLYGVTQFKNAREVGPLDVSIDGGASSLLLDGTAGYMITGGDHSLLSLDARAGVRYQRTAVVGALGVAGDTLTSMGLVTDGADALVGARAFVRPSWRWSFCGAVDLGLFGSSTSTWSASADASVRLGSHVQLSLGYRTLTLERSIVSVVLHGPRAALQLLF